MKKQFKKLATTALALSLVLTGCGNSSSNSSSGVTTASSSDAFDVNDPAVQAKTKQIESIIDNQFYFDEDKDKREEGYYDGIMQGLDDPYSVYYTPEEYKKLMEDDSGTFVGIGATVTKKTDTNLITIVKPLKDSPALKAGLLPNDVVEKVDDMEVTTDMELDYVVGKIRGEKGSTVTLKIYRPSDKKEYEFKIVRDQIQNETVEWEVLENNIGYISVDQFIENTADQFKKGMDDLQKQGVSGIVIDLRNNPGGLVTAVNAMTDYIIEDDAMADGASKKGILLETKNKYGKVLQSNVAKDGHSVDIPMVVLVNGNSASAAEIFTGCMKSYKKATIVGENTFGKGIVQSIIPLSDGSAIKITIAKYFIPNGDDIHKVGIAPDVEVKLDENLASLAEIPHNQDNQLAKGFEILGAKPLTQTSTSTDAEQPK